MKTIGIIAEFNPFHSGHKYLIGKCKRNLGADRVVVVMSGNFVQRGAPAITDKFSRARMALNSGADVVFELPVYYSLGSAEYFAEGAISVLNRLSCIDYLCFGSEDADIDRMIQIADILQREPAIYKEVLTLSLREGLPYPAASSKALNAALKQENSSEEYCDYSRLLSSPNSILAIEYLKSLKRTHSAITPIAVKRIGQPYHSLSQDSVPSASAIRAHILSGSPLYIKNNAPELLKNMIPDSAISEIEHYCGLFLNTNDFTSLIHYKLISEKKTGYVKYQDVSRDLSNKIVRNLENYESASGFCSLIKSKDILYSRISRCLMHILLNITRENMAEYKADGYTAYARVLGLKESSSDLLRLIKDSSDIPVFERLSGAEKLLSPLQMRLLNETLTASSIYNFISQNGITSEYRKPPLIV